MKDLWGYQGKRVVINGGSSGMGLAATKLLLELGAEVYLLDIKEPPTADLPGSLKKFFRTDLRRKETIDAALQEIPDPIDKVFACAGVPGAPFPDIEVMLVNFVGQRHMIESLIPRMVDGGAIALIASIGGVNWKKVYPILDKLLATQGFDEARAWLEGNPEAYRGKNDLPHLNMYSPQVYIFSKQCLVGYVKSRALELSKRGIRINVLCPGATETSLMPQFEANDPKGKEGIMQLVTSIGRYATAEEQGHPLVFLNSDMASYISGVDVVADFGFFAGTDVAAEKAKLRRAAAQTAAQ